MFLLLQPVKWWDTWVYRPFLAWLLLFGLYFDWFLNYLSLLILFIFFFSESVVTVCEENE